MQFNRRIVAGGCSLVVLLLSSATARQLSDKTTIKGSGAVSHAEHTFSLLCNITGPCEPCIEGQKKVARNAAPRHTEEVGSCAATGFRQDLRCIVDVPRGSVKHEIKTDLPKEFEDRPKGSILHIQHNCDRPSLTVATLMLIILFILCISLPVVVWRKRSARTVF